MPVKTEVTACNNAQRAYSYGKLNGANANRAYAESGMSLQMLNLSACL